MYMPIYYYYYVPLQAFKKRWFVLKYSEADGSFILEYYKVFIIVAFNTSTESLYDIWLYDLFKDVWVNLYVNACSYTCSMYIFMHACYPSYKMCGSFKVSH